MRRCARQPSYKRCHRSRCPRRHWIRRPRCDCDERARARCRARGRHGTHASLFLLEHRSTCFQYLGELAKDFIDLSLLDDKWRGQSEDVGGLANEQPALEAFEIGIEGARAGLARNRLKLDSCDETEI